MHPRLDPQLAANLQTFLSALGGEMRLLDIPMLRAGMSQQQAALKERLPEVPGITATDHRAPGPEGAPEVPVRVYAPAGRDGALPALLWIHGGGYVLGSVEQDDFFCRQIAALLPCVVVSVEYRLAPEHPFPAPVEDCYAALRWLRANAETLGVDPARIAIGGASAGGGLAAGLALLARDRGEVEVAFQLLIYPMIDDRNVEPAGAALPDTLLWSRESNAIGWRAYLGAEPGGAEVSPYAAAARAEQLAGLPPAFIAVGELDLFLHENIEYAQRLLRADVTAELHVYPGAFHGFEGIAPTADVSQRFITDRNGALRRALRG